MISKLKKSDPFLELLTAALTTQKDVLAKALLRLKDFTGNLLGTNFALHKKFFRLLDQVDVERKKEMLLIDKIEALEKHHRDLRRRDRLQRIALEMDRRNRRRLKIANGEIYPCDDNEDELPRGFNYWKAYALVYLFSSKPGFMDTLFSGFSFSGPKPAKQEPYVQ